MARLCPLFSGSKGNSYFIGTKTAGILIDAGRSAKQLEAALQACEIPISAVHGIFITHEHSDHVSALRVFAKRHGTPVFASRGTLRALGDSVAPGQGHLAVPQLQLADLEVTPFCTSHDCAEPFGYRIKTKEGRIITLSTDLGFVSAEVEAALAGANFCVIESNHDVEMLRTGPYPYYLQKRILSDRGHLSNDVCSALLPLLAKQGTRRFLLAHLSEENNTRRAAIDASLSALVRAGFIQGEDFVLDAANPANLEGKTIYF